MKKNYFFIISIFMLLLSVVAFSDLFYDVKQKSNNDPKYIIHGLFCFAWFILFFVQTNFIRKKDYRAHVK